jgi:hypothetical protein
MTRMKISITLVFLCVCTSILAQDTVEIFFDYKLSPTGNIRNSVDTVYELELLINVSDVNSFKEISLLNGSTRDNLQIPENPADNPKIQREKERYRIAMGNWINRDSVHIEAKRSDGKVVSLMLRKEKQKIHHPEKTLPGERRSLELPDDSPKFQREDVKELEESSSVSLK